MGGHRDRSSEGAACGANWGEGSWGRGPAGERSSWGSAGRREPRGPEQGRDKAGRFLGQLGGRYSPQGRPSVSGSFPLVLIRGGSPRTEVAACAKARRAGASLGGFPARVPERKASDGSCGSRPEAHSLEMFWCWLKAAQRDLRGSVLLFTCRSVGEPRRLLRPHHASRSFPSTDGIPTSLGTSPACRRTKWI